MRMAATLANDSWIQAFFRRQRELGSQVRTPLEAGRQRRQKRTPDEMLFDEIATTLKKFGLARLCAASVSLDTTDFTFLRMAKCIAEHQRNLDKQDSRDTASKSFTLRGERLLGRNGEPFLAGDVSPDVRNAGMAFLRATAISEGDTRNIGCGREQQKQRLKSLVQHVWGGELYDEMEIEIMRRHKLDAGRCTSNHGKSCSAERELVQRASRRRRFRGIRRGHDNDILIRVANYQHPE